MLAKDFLYALRSLLKSPVFALTAIVTIALGIGSSTAIFSVANAVLLRKLPYKDPERLVFDISDMRRRNVKDFPVSNAILIDFQNGSKTLYDSIAAVFTGRQIFPQADGAPEQIHWAQVTTNFFQTMGGKIVAGRDFNQDDGVPQPVAAQPTNPNAIAPPRLPQMAIISYEFWQRRFGGDPSIIGKPIPGIPQAQIIVAGVVAPHFELYFPSDADEERSPDIWYAARIPYDNANRMNVSYRMIGRLKDGVTLDQAQSSADQIAADMRRQYLIQNTSGFALRVEPLQQHVVEEVRPAILALTGAAIFLLLIACANVANLLLVRASLRERELAVRTAMGAKFHQLVRQMLAESVVISGAGAGLGLLLAWLGIRELKAVAPQNLPRLDAVSIDPAVLAFTAFAALGSAIVFGLAPALRSARPDLAQVLRSSGRTASLGSAGMLRNAVVVAEVALSFVLLIGSGLMFRSFVELQRIDPGFNPHNLLTFQLLGPRGNTPELRAAAEQETKRQLSELPGAVSVTAGAPFPLTGGFSPIRWGLETALSDSTKFQAVDFQVVLPGYFETMGTKLVAGRTFNDADNAPNRTGVIVDRILAAKAYPGQNAVGKQIYVRIRTPQPVPVEILGVVEHQRVSTLAEAGSEQIYFTDAYLGGAFANTWAIRTKGDPVQLAGQVHSTIAHLDPKLLIGEVQPMTNLVSKAQAHTRFQLLLIGVFAVMAVILAGVGLYGVLSTVVRQRTSEIGVRMALGAAPVKIFGLVVGQGMALSCFGVGVGVVAAALLTRVLQTMLVGVKPTDPLTFGAMVALFLAIAAVASWLPARRAAGLDPTVALRDE